jgi:hypothetical protein
MVQATRLDDYAAENRLDRIDLLKADTQGYELEILRGATGLLNAGRIKAIYCEGLFSELYEGQCYFHDIHSHLLQHQMKLCGFYGCARGPTGELMWADALYLNLRDK